MSGFKKVEFGNYPEYNNFIVVFKHKKQKYELQCTDMGSSFAFNFVRCIKDGKRYLWDYDNPIFDNVISKGQIK